MAVHRNTQLRDSHVEPDNIIFWDILECYRKTMGYRDVVSRLPRLLGKMRVASLKALTRGEGESYEYATTQFSKADRCVNPRHGLSNRQPSHEFKLKCKQDHHLRATAQQL